MHIVVHILMMPNGVQLLVWGETLLERKALVTKAAY